jgi:hypothetical protein
VSPPAARRGLAAALALVAALSLGVPATLGSAQMTGTRTFVVRSGPITLGAYQVRLDTSFPAAPGVHGDLVTMHARVVDAAGTTVPLTRVMLHHVLFSDEGRVAGDRRDGTCPYDASRPHAAAMAMLHVYLAPSRRPVARCAPLPRDTSPTCRSRRGRRFGGAS